MTNFDGIFDTVVIGAGQAGLGIAYWLKQDDRYFQVLERGRVGETWRSQRWDSFTLNTPNWANVLPGVAYRGPQADGFWTRDELVASFEQYVKEFELPVSTGVTVTAVEASAQGEGFTVLTDHADAPRLETRSVVVTSGIMQTPKFPALRSKIPDSVTQIHTADYRSPEALPRGAVVVVGGGQSGCQIVEDLLSAGRTVYLCTSKVGRIPRRYRGREIIDWAHDMGFMDVALEELEDPAMQFATQPQTSGVGRYGHTVSLQQLERDGAHLMGRLLDVEDGILLTDDKLPEYIRFADETSLQFKQGIDAYLNRNGIEPPPLEDDPADLPAPENAGCDAPTNLDLTASNVTSIIWCTGFTADFSWIHLPVLDSDGMPRHNRGISSVPGVYFLGFPWLHSRKSGILLGVAEDSKHIASAIAEFLS